jgi:DNA-binding MarR family transcriptional regulator
MRAYLERVAAESGIELPVAQCWLLVQYRRHGSPDLGELAERHRVPIEALESALSELDREGLVATRDAEHDGGTGSVDRTSARSTDLTPARDGADMGGRFTLTTAGAEVADRLIANVRSRLEGLLAGWSPEQYPDLVKLLTEFAAEVVPQGRVAVGPGPTSPGP